MRLRPRCARDFQFVLLGVVERDEAIDDGLPGNDVSQGDELIGRIGHMGFDPLRTEGILKSLCYHDMDLFEGVR